MAEVTKPVILDETGQAIVAKLQAMILAIQQSGGSGGTSNYNALTNKPKIGDVVLEGVKTLSDLGIQAAGNYAAGNHTHEGVYQPAGEYASSSHNHDEKYSQTNHTHEGTYAPTSHNHDGDYQPVGDYATQEALTQIALNVRKVASEALPDGGILDSGKTYGSPSSPIASPSVINGLLVVTETVVYYTVAAGQTINFVGKLNDVPTEAGKTAVVSFENGIAVFGIITTA